MQSDGLHSPMSPAVYGDIALRINTQYSAIQYNIIPSWEQDPVLQHLQIFFETKKFVTTWLLWDADNLFSDHCPTLTSLAQPHAQNAPKLF